jgi:hypothetical protein
MDQTASVRSASGGGCHWWPDHHKSQSFHFWRCDHYMEGVILSAGSALALAGYALAVVWGLRESVFASGETIMKLSLERQAASFSF